MPINFLAKNIMGVYQIYIHFIGPWNSFVYTFFSSIVRTQVYVPQIVKNNSH
jgi:hypothetical protein